MHRFLRTLFLLGLLGSMAAPAQAQIDKLPHPDTTAGNFFGVAVSIDGDRALVGASSEDACGPNSGAAYIFERNPETNLWREAARLTALTCKPGEFFGRSVSLSGDRAMVAASAEFFAQTSTNAAYVFERDSTTGTWEQSARLKGNPDKKEGAFAASVSLDGERALITTWGDPSDAQYSGTAYLFELDPSKGIWKQTARLTGSRGLEAGVFGGPAALDGDYAVVTASSYFQENRSGSIYIFEHNATTGQWTEAAHFGNIDDFYISVDIDGDRVVVGESKDGRQKSGAATIYSRDARGSWHLSATLHPPVPYDHGAFGSEVVLDDNRVLITGYDEQLRLDFNIDRVVYVFECDAASDAWQYRSIIDIGEVAFGSALDLDGHVALIGHASERAPGAAYVVLLR